MSDSCSFYNSGQFEVCDSKSKKKEIECDCNAMVKHHLQRLINNLIIA